MTDDDFHSSPPSPPASDQVRVNNPQSRDRSKNQEVSFSSPSLSLVFFSPFALVSSRLAGRGRLFGLLVYSILINQHSRIHSLTFGDGDGSGSEPGGLISELVEMLRLTLLLSSH